MVTSERAHVLPSSPKVLCVSHTCGVAGKRALDKVQTTSLSEAELAARKRIPRE